MSRYRKNNIICIDKKQDWSVREQIELKNDQALVLPGYDDAIIGVCYQSGRPPVVAYDYNLVITHLMGNDDMTYEEAVEYYEFNIEGSFLGDSTPVFIQKLSKTK